MHYFLEILCFTVEQKFVCLNREIAVLVLRTEEYLVLSCMHLACLEDDCMAASRFELINTYSSSLYAIIRIYVTIISVLYYPFVVITETLKFQLERLQEHNAWLVSHVSKLNFMVFKLSHILYICNFLTVP